MHLYITFLSLKTQQAVPQRIPARGFVGWGVGELLPEAVVPEKPTPLEGQVQSLQKVPRTSPAKLWSKTEATECCGEEWAAMLSEAGIALTNLCTLLCLFASFPPPSNVGIHSDVHKPFSRLIMEAGCIVFKAG